MSPPPPLPTGHLAGAGQVDPGIWRAIDELRAGTRWPDWCFVPVTEIIRLIRRDWRGRHDLHLMAEDAGRLACLTAWRATQGIYRFDPELYAALITPPPVTRLPAEILTLMPEWGVYIEAPWLGEFDGFFACCDYNPRLRLPVLLLLLQMPDNLVPVSIPILDGMLSDAINIAAPGFGKRFAEWYQPLVSLVLYICSVAAGFSHYPLGHPTPVPTRRGSRIFPPEKPVITLTGEETGALLRASRGGSRQHKGGKSDLPLIRQQKMSSPRHKIQRCQYQRDKNQPCENPP